MLEIYPAYSGGDAYRVEFFGDEVERITEIDSLTGEGKTELGHIAIFPASHYVVSKEKLELATQTILAELKEQVAYFKSEDKLLEAQRISERTNFDVEMMRETGFCSGIASIPRQDQLPSVCRISISCASMGPMLITDRGNKCSRCI